MINLSKQFIYKKWDYQILLSYKSEIKTRCEKIEVLSKLSPIIPNTNFEWGKERLIQRQVRIKNTTKISNYYNFEKLRDLAILLDIKDSLNLIHGDICPRNILWSDFENSYFVIDWEPDLFQIRNGKKSHITTVEYAYPKDKYTKAPCSLKGDKYSFIKTLHKCIKKEFTFASDKLLDLTYISILKKIIQ
ncbi:MAG: hypothetical protein ACI8PF_000486 [Flavobacteriaceae bacterium]|jgi:hypothetical protein|tara:strand:- start:1582 stop:2151 length:570 start_codon:yes stop_codon:yes gene_type:complete